MRDVDGLDCPADRVAADCRGPVPEHHLLHAEQVLRLQVHPPPLVARPDHRLRAHAPAAHM